MSKVLYGFTWQKPPTVGQYEAWGTDSWYMSGFLEIEIIKVADELAPQGLVYLQEDGTWGGAIHYFSSQGAVKTALGKKPAFKAIVSAIAAAFLKKE